MEVSGAGKSPNASLSFRYNANNEELEELFNACEDDPSTPQCDPPAIPSENASPKRGDRTPSIIDKYFKSMRSEKVTEKDKTDDVKQEAKDKEDSRSSTPKEVSSSPMKEYLNRLGKRSTPEVNPEVKEPSSETWKIFHDFKFKIAQAVEDMKTKSVEETKDEKKTLPRENSASDSEENSAVKDIDQQSVGDTDNQVSSLDSSMQNLSEITQPITAKPMEQDLSLPIEKNHSDSSDDTHKNLVYSEMVDERDLLTDSLLDVESGIEALEDTMDNFGEITHIPLFPKNSPTETPTKQKAPTTPNAGLPPSNSDLPKHDQIKPPKRYFCNYTMYFITIFFLINLILFPNSNVWIGFLLGIWFFLLVGNVKQWLLDTYFSDREPRGSRVFQVKRSSAMPVTYTIPSVKEHRPLKKYEGWINHYRFPDYNPLDYHINKSTTAFMKLEGCNLRISYSSTKVAKRALWDEKLDKVTFYQHRLYNLVGARVILLPKGLVKRRQWSKKYPICVILNEKEKIQVLEKENMEAERKVSDAIEKKKEQQFETESTETNTSPEKKKKFVWRRKEKNLSHSDPVEPGKEGLRHRLVRKMHRDKKTDSVSTCTEPVAEPPTEEKRERSADDLTDEMELTSKSTTSNKEEEEEVEIDENEMTKIKEFLEEADSMENADEENTEGEWSVHVKSSKDKHSLIYLFARTGRDKFEWFRRLSAAVSEVASTESSTSEDNVPETFGEKEPIELAVYKMTADKDSVAFAKNSNKSDSVSDNAGGGVTITSLNQHALPHEFELYERNFWPYLMKIIQTHEITLKKQTAEMGVMCQLEPTPKEHSKNKKKKNSDMIEVGNFVESFRSRIDTGELGLPGRDLFLSEWTALRLSIVPVSHIKTPAPDCECRLLPAEVTWVNTALARLMYDLTRDPVMIARVQHRIQRKLCTLKLPSFMSPLVVTELSLSGACPLVERVLPVSYDARGVWLDADLRYDGGAFIALSTQINLMKLKKKNVTLEDQMLLSSHSDNLLQSDTGPHIASLFSERNLRKPAIYDSECEDSAESSSDDESPPIQPVDSTDNVSQQESTVSAPPPEGGSSKKKFLRMVDKIAMNKYFQQVTDYKYVKRAMEGLSNTDIKLHLEVHCLEGRLCLNLPPPPHDRVWIGFRTNPQLVLKARPAVGARTLRFAHISNWIEQKLSKEFEKVLVLPNMEDIIVDVMTPTPVNFE